MCSSGWPRSGWPLSTTLCYKSVTGLNHHTALLLIFYMVGSDIRKKYWKFHNDTVNSFGVMGKGNAIFQPYFHVTMSHFKFSYFVNSCPHKIEVIEPFIDFCLHSKYGFIWFIGHLMQITWKMTKLWHFTKKTDFVTHFSKNVDAILPKCFKTLFSVVSFWYLVWWLSTTVVLIYLKENTSKQVLHSLMHVRKWYWWCHQKPVVYAPPPGCSRTETSIYQKNVLIR